ncbi:hypothetical protein N7457_008664 [Penicillium paradoxum]|uniref:uncharacterized protein n=1 Tax=Penicillium paradoxum TaxID=176176 RepID=UPI002547CC2D|nr:uncharacterized protein N7457_008664 [Penicillium paradoxum]KAJ5773768.1 hypothetical protein N7457_008664 [Penicillium paradoxum]
MQVPRILVWVLQLFLLLSHQYADAVLSISIPVAHLEGVFEVSALSEGAHTYSHRGDGGIIQARDTTEPTELTTFPTDTITLEPSASDMTSMATTSTSDSTTSSSSMTTELMTTSSTAGTASLTNAPTATPTGMTAKEMEGGFSDLATISDTTNKIQIGTTRVK